MKLIFLSKRNPRNTVLWLSACGANYTGRIDGVIDRLAPAYEINWRGITECTDDPADVAVIDSIKKDYYSGIQTRVGNFISNDTEVGQEIDDYLNGTTLGRAPNLKPNTRAAQRAAAQGKVAPTVVQPAVNAAPVAQQVAPTPAAVAQPQQEMKLETQPKVETEVKVAEAPKVEPVTPTVTASSFKLSRQEYNNAEKEFSKNLEKGAAFLLDNDLVVNEGTPLIDIIDTRITNTLMDIALSKENIPGSKKEYTITNYIYGAMMLATGDDEKAKRFLKKTRSGTGKDEWNLFLSNFEKYARLLVTANGGLPIISNRLHLFIGKPSAGKDFIISKLYPTAERVLATGSKEAVDYVNPPKFVEGKGMDYVQGAIVRIADKNNASSSHICYIPEGNMMQSYVQKEVLQPLTDNSDVYKYGDGVEDQIEIHPEFRMIMSLNPTSNTGSIHIFEQPLISRMGRIYVYDIDAEDATERALDKDNKGKMKSLDDFIKTNPTLLADAKAAMDEIVKQRKAEEEAKKLAEEQRKLNEAQAALNAKKAQQEGIDINE